MNRPAAACRPALLGAFLIATACGGKSSSDNEARPVDFLLMNEGEGPLWVAFESEFFLFHLEKDESKSEAGTPVNAFALPCEKHCGVFTDHGPCGAPLEPGESTEYHWSGLLTRRDEEDCGCYEEGPASPGTYVVEIPVAPQVSPSGLPTGCGSPEVCGIVLGRFADCAGRVSGKFEYPSEAEVVLRVQ